MTTTSWHCTCCPRRCGVDRYTGTGFCRAPYEPEVASICVHKGEEPPLCGEKGICNIFFAHCNLQCLFCQNRQISGREVEERYLFYRSLGEVCDRIEEVLRTTENVIGFVSPSHYAYLVPEIMEELYRRGQHPTVVYNTNGYDSVESLRMVAPYVDIYLPDLKYMDSALAGLLSHAPDYPEVAKKALAEMYSQMGSGLKVDDDGMAYRGMIVRHLILPSQVENSLRVLDWMAENLSVNIHVSLMSQYTPVWAEGETPEDVPAYLLRTITEEEYDRVVEHFYALGFHRGWVQEFTSQQHYVPQFANREAFESNH